MPSATVMFKSFAVLFPLILVITLPASTQEHSRFEIGGQFSGIRLLNSSGRVVTSPGFGGRFDFNLNRRLALEARLDFFPQDAAIRYQSQGGKSLQFASGVRGKFMETRRFAVYGIVLPGLLHFTNAITSFTTTMVPGTNPPLTIVNSVNAAATHFALDLGGGLEFYPTRRLVTRVEFSGDLYTIPGTSVPISKPNPSGAFLSLLFPADIARTWRFSVGLGYRVAPLREEPKETRVSGRGEFGPQFTTMFFRSALASNVLRKEPGFGGFFSYELFPYVYADASLNFYPREGRVSTPFDGGRVLQGLAGFKTGVRTGRYGVFGKARAGVAGFSRVIASFNVSPPSATDTASYATALDLGGVVEVYVKRHMLLRFDASDVLSFYHDRVTFFQGQRIHDSAPARTDAIQMSAGFGWRF